MEWKIKHGRRKGMRKKWRRKRRRERREAGQCQSDGVETN